MSQITPASDKIQREENKIARLENDKEIQMNHILIGNPGLSSINQSILSSLDHQYQMSFRSVCQSWKEQVDQPYFWIKKLDSKGQSKNLHNSWIKSSGSNYLNHSESFWISLNQSESNLKSKYSIYFARKQTLNQDIQIILQGVKP